MTLFKLWLTFIVMENYEWKIIIPTKSTACNSIHTSMIFVPKSHNYNLLWGWKGYDTAYPCKECSYYKILSIFLPQQSKKNMHTCSIGTGFQKEKFPEKFIQFFFYHEMQESNLMDRFECS